MTPNQYLDNSANDLAGAKQNLENAMNEDNSSDLASIYSDLEAVYERLEAYLESKKNGI